jgi:DNA-binding transcriptional regulator YiaG
VFKFGTLPDGSMRRVEVNPKTHRRKVVKEWKTKTEVARARQTLNLTQDAFAGRCGAGNRASV